MNINKEEWLENIYKDLWEYQNMIIDAKEGSAKFC